jgi:predicted enzyme related to lactoylglutathione lyase
MSGWTFSFLRYNAAAYAPKYLWIPDIPGGSSVKVLEVEGFHTVLLCRKWEECVAFYRDLFGFKTVDSRPGFVEVEVSAGSYIGLIRRTRDYNLDNEELALVLTFRVANLEEAHKILAARCREVSEILEHPWGARLFKMQDPEGRRLEIWARQ